MDASPDPSGKACYDATMPLAKGLPAQPPPRGKPMRKVFLEIENVKSHLKAIDVCPWSAKVLRVEGGWMCFESADDAANFDRQK